MDTSSHIIMGFGLAALAHIDPVVANQPALSQAVMFGTVIGSISRSHYSSVPYAGVCPAAFF